MFFNRARTGPPPRGEGRKVKADVRGPALNFSGEEICRRRKKERAKGQRKVEGKAKFFTLLQAKWTRL